MTANGISLRRGLPYLVAAGLGLLASLINPYGWHYWPYVWIILNHSRAMIDEWQAVPLWSADYLSSKALALASVSGMALAVWRACTRRTRHRTAESLPDAVPLLVLGVLLYLGFRHVKHLPLFVIGAAIYLPLLVAAPLSGWWQRQPARERLARVVPPSLRQSIVQVLPLGLTLAALIHLGVLLTRVNPVQVAVHPEDDPADALRLSAYPVEAIRFLEGSAYHGRLFTPFNWGEFSYWVLYPRFLVSLDGRYDSLYQVEAAERLNSFYTTTGLDWGVVTQTGADFILLDRDYHQAISSSSARPEIPSPWVTLYENPKFMVLGRPDAIAQADPSPRLAGRPERVASGRSVSSFWDPALDRIRFARYGPSTR